MSASSRAPKPSYILISTFTALLLVAGCDHGRTLNLHYTTTTSAARTAGVFFPAKVAIAPAAVPPHLELGAIFDAQGYRQTTLRSDDLGREIADIVAKSLEHAGLQPEVMNVTPANLPLGIDFVITSELLSLHCVKRYIEDSRPASEAFTMTAGAQLRFALAGRGGQLFSGIESGWLAEPPQGADLHKYKPPIDDPADAVSAVVSQAVAKLIADPGFQQVLPRRALPSSSPTPTSEPQPTRSPAPSSRSR